MKKTVTETTESLTKREYFAACALQGLLAHYGDKTEDEEQMTLKALLYAEALIKQLK